MEYLGQSQLLGRHPLNITFELSKNFFEKTLWGEGRVIVHYDTGKESTGTEDNETADGEITSTVDGSETPTENDQSNFGEGFAYRHIADGTLEIFMNEKWIVFEHRTGTGSQVRFGDRWVDRDGLSEETLDWLAWFNSLSEEEQLSVSAVPPDLLEESGISGTEDAEATSN